VLIKKYSNKKISNQHDIIHDFYQTFFPLLLCAVGLHCVIYKGSYILSNTSYMNSPSPLLSFISPSPNSWNSFNRYHFCIYIRVHIFCTIFTPFSPFPIISLLPLVPALPLGNICFALWFFNFVEEGEKMKRKT
jgi:hypothetical protein